jgi:hypothetical protein
VPDLATTRHRNAVRNQDAKSPGPAFSRRARQKQAEAMLRQDDPALFGAFATSDFSRDMMRARWDVGFFARRFLGVDPHPGQERLFKAYIMRDESRYAARFLTIAAAAGNRAGKTLGLAIVIAHATLFKTGRIPPNPLDERAIERWLSTPYEWYHFGIHTEIAELVYHEIVRILSGTHEAQKDGCPLTEIIGTEVADWSRKHRGEYAMIVWHPMLGGGTIHFRTTGERAIGSLGKDMDGESYDECAFEPNFDFVINEVLHLRRLSTGGQLILMGTMTEGLTAFADKWEEGNPDNPSRMIDSMSVRISTRENIGYGIDQKMFDRLLAAMPPYLVPQNIDGYAIESREAYFGATSVNAIFHDEKPDSTPAAKGHTYVVGVDPALTYDSTWVITLDVTGGGQWHGAFIDRLSGRQTTLTVSGLALHTYNAYNDTSRRISCKLGVDATGFGGKMFRDLIPVPVTMVEFGGTRQKKLLLLQALKKAIEEGRLVLPRTGKWLGLRRQLLGYKLDDRKIEQDAVMALAVAVHLARRYAGDSAQEVSFDFFAPHDQGVDSGPELLRRLGITQQG